MKDVKIKCHDCNNTLYISVLGDIQYKNKLLCIGSEPNAKKGFKNFQGVVIELDKLLKLLK